MLKTDLIRIAELAGEAIMNVYNDNSLSQEVDYKSDNSPLTLADKASHNVIMAELEKISDYPILSEEAEEAVDYDVRSKWETYWCVDPLDGTKEFIKRNGEFTVNIALIKNGVPVQGVIFVPVTNTTYYGDQTEAIKIVDGKVEKLEVGNSSSNRIAVRSKSHAAEAEEEILARYDAHESISVGSSLKFCMVAEGKADIYYRHGPTMEWDTAAGQAVLEAAGGKVYHGQSSESPFRYNKVELLNSSFLCLGFEG